MHFEAEKSDAGHYHQAIELRDDNGQLAANIHASRRGITIQPAAGWHLRTVHSDDATEAHIEVEPNT
jgi:hypothetical protein